MRDHRRGGVDGWRLCAAVCALVALAQPAEAGLPLPDGEATDPICAMVVAAEAHVLLGERRSTNYTGATGLLAGESPSWVHEIGARREHGTNRLLSFAPPADRGEALVDDNPVDGGVFGPAVPTFRLQHRHRPRGTFPRIREAPDPPRRVVANPDHRRMTQNGMGYESINWDPITEAFAQTPLTKDKPVLLLDAGCGYGRISRAAAANGGTVVCNDLDARHLVALAEEMDPVHRGRFMLHVGNFLEAFPVRYAAFDAILVSRMAHFLSPKNFRKLLRQCWRLLLPGGRLHITTATPRNRSFQNFLPVYEARKRSGAPWPGYIDGRSEKVIDYWPDARGRYPNAINLFDPDVMNRELAEAKFEMTQPADWMANPDTPPEHALDGRELVGAIVTKPVPDGR